MSDVLRQLYLVVPARNGWAVNLGADTIRVCQTREQARLLATALAAAAIAEGEAAGFMDPDLADELGTASRGARG
jgi:hypothetical protein